MNAKNQDQLEELSDVLEGLSKIRELLDQSLTRLEAERIFDLVHQLIKRAYSLGMRHTVDDITKRIKSTMIGSL